MSADSNSISATVRPVGVCVSRTREVCLAGSRIEGRAGSVCSGTNGFQLLVDQGHGDEGAVTVGAATNAAGEMGFTT